MMNYFDKKKSMLNFSESWKQATEFTVYFTKLTNMEQWIEHWCLCGLCILKIESEMWLSSNFKCDPFVKEVTEVVGFLIVGL
jgi:hypothetical protein